VILGSYSLVLFEIVSTIESVRTERVTYDILAEIEFRASGLWTSWKSLRQKRETLKILAKKFIFKYKDDRMKKILQIAF